MFFGKEQIGMLRNPISIELPCGSYLKEAEKDSYRQIRSEFNLALATLRKLSQNPGADDIDLIEDEYRKTWSTLSEHLFEIFQTKTQDIELIGWFICSQLILDDSLEGIANGFNWLSELTEKQWSFLNPVLPENSSSEGIDSDNAKVSAFSLWAGDSETSGLLYAPLLFQPLVGSITFFDYKSAEHKGNISELKTVANAQLERERERVKVRLANVAQCKAAIAKIEHFLATQLTPVNARRLNFVHLNKLFNMLEDALVQLSGLSSIKPDNSQANSTSLENKEPDIDKSSPLLSLSRDLPSRDVAFHQLREIADYFRRSEPHSPVSYLLEKAIVWGYLQLPELLKELLSEQDEAITKIFNTAGLSYSEQISLPPLPDEARQTHVEKSDRPLTVEGKKRHNEIIIAAEQQEGHSPTTNTALSW